MPQDAFTLRRVATALDAKLEGAKVNKINQPVLDEIVIHLYNKGEVFKLLISANAIGARISLTAEEKPNPLTAHGFCMLLRKHLLGSIIESVELVGFERIIKITFSGRNDFRETVKKVLYAEIMGKYSNLILTENGIILGCQKNAPLDVATTRVTLSGAE
jgi:predicted ribosome quality control (RQC) complex YloA/Tae2 family protein